MQLTHLLLALAIAFTAEAAVANNSWRYPPWFPRPRPRPGRPTIPTVSTTPAPVPISQCAAGGAQCCNSVQRADNPQAAGLLNLLGAANVPATTQVGVTCLPISVINIGTSPCAKQPVCCTGNTFNGIIAVGCVPLAL